METNAVFDAIGRSLPSGEAVLVLSALRQDTLLWASLEDDAFLALVLETARDARSWSPGRLALLTLSSLLITDLRSEPLVELPQELRDQAMRAYQLTQRTGTAPTTLREAGLLALALRERRRMTGTWDGLRQEICAKSAQASFATWRAPLACLYEMIPDPEDMLRALAPDGLDGGGNQWIVHTQLCQPRSQAEHLQALTGVLRGLPVMYQLAVLRSLCLRGQETLAGAIADRLLTGHPAFAGLRAQSNPQVATAGDFANRALALQQMAGFYQLAGDRKQALSLINAAETTLGQWLAGIYLQRLNLQTGRDEDTIVLMTSSQLSHLANSACWMKDELGAVLISHPNASGVLEQINSDPDSALIQLRRARDMMEREPAVARDLARQGAQGLREAVERLGVPFEGEYIFTWRPKDALKILLDLDLTEDALRLAEAVMQVRPVDVSLLQFAGQMHERLGNLHAAGVMARRISYLEPNNPRWLREMGRLSGLIGQWEQAFQDFSDVLALAVPAQISDRLACAQAALRAGRSNQAVELCEAVLGEDANSGAAMSILGQALAARGDMQKALPYLVRATLMLPDSLETWLALAQAQIALEEPQRALETLRSAVTIAPEAAEAHTALGETCVAMGLLSEALPHLKKAFLVSPDGKSSALQYGRALRLLGHSSEARAVLERVRDQWPACPELAYEYAQVLMDTGDPQGALPVLEMALRNGLPVLDGHLLYARVLLGACSAAGSAEKSAATLDRLETAAAAMDHILELDPQNIEARFLSADLYLERGELDCALAAYRALADLPVANATELRWRVQWGLGRTALQLNQLDTALAAFQEACLARPDHLPLKRGLAEATLRAGLMQEALNSAVEALQLKSGDIENLVWYAEFVARLDEYEQAIDALECAAQIAPQRLDILLLLAEYAISGGNQSKARASLQQVCAASQAGSEDLRRAGQLYLRMEDQAAALACFTMAIHAVQASGDAPQPALLVEMAELSERMGHVDEALALMQQASDLAPTDLQLLLIQVDYLNRLDRPQAALAGLEHALRAAEQSGAPDGVICAIHQRFASHWRGEGSLPRALEHAEKALALQPGSPLLVFQAANLALALLQKERAERTLTLVLPEGQRAGQFLEATGPLGLDILCLRMEQNLEDGRDEAAASLVVEGLGYDAGAARVLAARSRLLARSGDTGGALRCYQSAREAHQAGAENSCVEFSPPIWLAEAALEVMCWQEGLEIWENCTRSYPADARSWLGLARALTLAVETQKTCEMLGCTKNAPGTSVFDEQHQRSFLEAIQAAGRIASTPEINHWLSRGQAVFTPNNQSTRALAAVATAASGTAADTAALIRLLRQSNNLTAARQVATRYPNDPAVLLELSFCGQEEVREEGLCDAMRAFLGSKSRLPAGCQRPLMQAGLAQLARRKGQPAEALAGYQEALAAWSNEPAWHDLAGDLCVELDQREAALQHRLRAFALEPRSADFARKLGQLYTAQGDILSAIDTFEKATRLDPAQSSVWLALAAAYQSVGRLPEALEAAKQAGTAAQKDVEGLLVAGEIALEMHMPEQALAFAQSALRLEPENMTGLLFYTNVLEQMDRGEEALAVLESASAAVKALAPVAKERARLVYEQKGARNAQPILEKLITDNPDDAALLALMASVQAECGDARAAERWAFQSLRLQPDQPELTLMLGRLQHADGQLDQAVHLLGEVIRLAPETLEAYLELGAVYQERHEYHQALQIYRQAMRIASNDYRPYYQCGIILRDSKDYPGAEEQLRRAAELAPENLSIRRQLVGVIALNLVHAHQEMTA